MRIHSAIICDGKSSRNALIFRRGFKITSPDGFVSLKGESIFWNGSNVAVNMHEQIIHTCLQLFFQ